MKQVYIIIILLVIVSCGYLYYEYETYCKIDPTLLVDKTIVNPPLNLGTDINPPPINIHAFHNIPNKSPEPNNFHNEAHYTNGEPWQPDASNHMPAPFTSYATDKLHPNSYPFSSKIFTPASINIKARPQSPKFVSPNEAQVSNLCKEYRNVVAADEDDLAQ
jgi:hypothetical protein